MWPLPNISIYKFVPLGQVWLLREKFSSILYRGIYLYASIHKSSMGKGLRSLLFYMSNFSWSLRFQYNTSFQPTVSLGAARSKAFLIRALCCKTYYLLPVWWKSCCMATWGQSKRCDKWKEGCLNNPCPRENNLYHKCESQM